MLSLIKSRVMIIDVLRNCKMIIIAQVFSIKSPNILLHALRKRRKKESKTKNRKRMKKIGMNINEKKNIRSFAQLNILHISRAIRFLLDPVTVLLLVTSHTRRVVIKTVLRKMVKINSLSKMTEEEI